MAAKKLLLPLSTREAKVTAEAMEHLSAYTTRELTDHLGWSLADQRAWAAVTGRLAVMTSEDRA